MKRREQIIILLAVIAVGFWLYDAFLTPAGDRGKADSLADSLAIAASLKKEMGKGAFDPPPGVAETMQKIDLRWEEDSFVSRKTFAMLNRKEQDTARETGPEIDPARYLYSGFLGSESRLVAIINGLDYLEGDTIDGLRVDRITAQAVHLRQGASTVAIPLVEE